MAAKQLRIVFAGTPEFAARHLACLLNEKFDIVSAYSQPDRPTGRGKKLEPTPVKRLAESRGVAVSQPPVLDAAALHDLKILKPDLMIVVAYGLLLPAAALEIPRLGCINVHASLLPRWRGAAPIERAILAGDTETGVSIMQMEAGLDTGPVFATATTAIAAEDNSATLTERLMTLGCEALIQVVAQLAAGSARATPQPDTGVLYARKLGKEEAAVRWSDSADATERQIRAFFPRSPAYCLYHEQRLRILRAELRRGNFPGVTAGAVIDMSPDAMTVACGSDALTITQVQLEGKVPMTLRELLNGRPDYFQRGSMLLSAR